MKFRSFFDIDTKRFEAVYKDVADGSEPGARFYILVAVSTLIACFGLVANSTAVVIGAMLVAPLMTPIFGIAVGLIRADTHLFRNAVQAEIFGVIAAVAMAVIVGFFLTFANPYPTVTPEMLARTKPNLIDLLVAVLAGFAGSYALVDEKISPALPGVAIATAIVPPLANSGLCIAYGAYKGALGSFLLFLANFLSILLVASIIFARARLNREHRRIENVQVARRFSFAIICFICMTIFLGHSLYRMQKDRKLQSVVRKELVEEFEKYPATGIEKLVVNNYHNKIYILAQIYSPNIVTPDQVLAIEREIAEKTNIPTELIVRTIKTSDTSSRGSNTVASAQGLDGFFVSQETDPKVLMIRMAEQAIREYLDDYIGLDLMDVDYFELHRGPTIMAMITGIRRLSANEIQTLENLVRERTDYDNLDVVIRLVHVDLYDKDGIVRYGMVSLRKPDESQLQIAESIIKEIKSEFRGKSMYSIDRVTSSLKETEYAFLVELNSTGSYQQSDLIDLQNKLAPFSDKPVKVFVWVNDGAVVTDQGILSYDRFTQNRIKSYTLEERQRLKEVMKTLR